VPLRGRRPASGHGHQEEPEGEIATAQEPKLGLGHLQQERVEHRRQARDGTVVLEPADGAELA
jgi:hypothetical protein